MRAASLFLVFPFVIGKVLWTLHLNSTVTADEGFVPGALVLLQASHGLTLGGTILTLISILSSC